ncbi:3-deoxy-D-manno-octulosonic acid kinase [Aliiglaciecola litoralis]|uniref:3-deoxy-D-manno-octulosonic acid kinase n=1 Tax=Aliiglaciecola litoralis TaxID=582857 RepID=A0ABN1LII7_9ALTE
MANQHEFSDKNQFIWVDNDLLPDLIKGQTHNYFDGQYWQSKGALIGTSVGRGTTYFFQHNDRQFVLRHYRRGGMIGKLLSDQYLYTGLAKTRAEQERKLLQHLQELGLPAPIPAASRVVKNGFYYQADLITVKIPDATDIHHILLERALPDDVWQQIGTTIARFHQQQIYHHDLNIHNIMLDKNNKVWLIDFDKCSVKAGDSWKQDNLDRLLRSLRKEQQKCIDYNFQSVDWVQVIKGYKS